MSDELDREDFSIGLSDKEGAVMIVTIPLRKWAMDQKHGDVLISGTFIKAERVALNIVNTMRQENKKKNGLFVPSIIGKDGKPVTVQ